MTVGFLKQMLAQVPDHCPVLIFDELCSGTEPCTKHSGMLSIPAGSVNNTEELPLERLFVPSLDDQQLTAFCLFTPGTMEPRMIVNQQEQEDVV
jgi:hypothetical protein